MRRKLGICAAALAIAGLAGAAGLAQDTVMAELYGQGVHAFFAGQYEQAVTLLTTVVESGTRDPRCHYFRGLAYAKLGHPEKAEADFKKGGELESSNTDGIYAVSLALQRIQGPQRLEIERYRQEARVAARIRSLEASKARYEQQQRADQELQRPAHDLPAVKPEDLLGKPPAPAPSDPFAADAQPQMEKAPAKPAPPEEKPAPAVAAEAPAPSPPPAEKPKQAEDPFGIISSKTPAAEKAPAETPAAEAPAAPKPTDPFADVTPAPAAPAEPAPAAETKPAPTPPAAEGPAAPKPADPFGDVTPAPAAPAEPAPAAETKPAPSPPAAEAPAAPKPADPFGDVTPAPAAPAKPSGGASSAADPFGDVAAAPAKAPASKTALAPLPPKKEKE